MARIERTPELDAEIDRLGDEGEFEQQGYLMAPALMAYTLDSFEGMIATCEFIKAMPFQSPEHIARADGTIRWCREHMEKKSEH